MGPGLRAEQLSRVGFLRVDPLGSVFYKLTGYIIRCWTFDVERSMLIEYV
jgi:hypothetical protein